jgi:hypothetical protein
MLVAEPGDHILTSVGAGSAPYLLPLIEASPTIHVVNLLNGL